MIFRQCLGLGFALAAIACPPSASAYSEDEPLNMVFVDDAVSTDRSREGTAPALANTWPSFQGCNAGLGRVHDVRPNKSTVGGWFLVLGYTPLAAGSLVSGDGQKWLQGALGSLEMSGFKAASPGTPAIDVGLRLAQTWTSAMNLQAHVALSVKYPNAQGEPVTRRYHGFGTRVNGMNANSEYMSTLNLAMLDALKGFTADLQNFCDKGSS